MDTHAAGDGCHVEGCGEFGIEESASLGFGQLQHILLVDVEVHLQHPVHTVVADDEDSGDVVVGSCPKSLNRHHGASVADDTKNGTVRIGALGAHGRSDAATDSLAPGATQVPQAGGLE